MDIYEEVRVWQIASMMDGAARAHNKGDRYAYVLYLQQMEKLHDEIREYHQFRSVVKE